MERECVSLLPRVCEVLANSVNSLPDDTSLEKLLDWLAALSEAGGYWMCPCLSLDKGGSLLDTCPCLLDFPSAVISNMDMDPAVLSFTLKLTGLLAATEDGFRRLQDCSILDQAFLPERWQEAGLWEDPSVRIGWIQGLNNLLQHPKALRFFVESGFTQPLLQLHTDTSLFVASAANQLLGHTLVFFQPDTSAECNGICEKEEHSGILQTPSKDPGAEYTGVVLAISQYMKQSVVPKDQAQLHRSRQVLRLLALILDRAGPALRDRLLHTVADALQELVTAGYSALTLPLIDVILAAHSSGADDNRSDQRVTHLLLSMLNINKPCDLIHTAAAYLHRGRHDTIHTAWAVRTLLLPLNIITGQTLLGTNTTEDEFWLSMSEQLKSKTSCISIICVCLTNAPQIALLPSGVLPCPPGLIVTAVLSLLRICCGTSSTGYNQACRSVIGSGKVEKCALEALIALHSSAGAKEKTSEVFTVLIQHLDNPASDPTVIHKSYQALVKWMCVRTELSFITEQLSEGIVDVVRKRVCDMRWEVRDSSLEFLGHLAGVQLGDGSGALLERCVISALLREALQDSESYVRASAISALAKTLVGGWQQGAALSQEESEIVSQLLELLSQDTEGFPRRAVVQFFITWFTSHCSHSTPMSPSGSALLLMQSVRTVLSCGSADLDWEVKVHTLELAQLLLDEAFSSSPCHREGSDRPSCSYGVLSAPGHTSHTHGSGQAGTGADVEVALSCLEQQGMVEVLLSGLLDCDRPVALQACRLLLTLKDRLCPPASAARVSCQLPTSGWGLEVRKMLGLSREAESSSVSVGVCELLGALGLDQRLDELSQSSDHIHNSPLSLLQDILTATSTHTQTQTQPGKEVVVDCY